MNHHFNHIDHTGIQYNYLKCLELAEARNGTTFWKCLCICGTIHEVSIASLIKGKTKSCGCMKSKLIASSKLRDPEFCAINVVFRNTKNRANKYKINFSLSINEFETFIFKNCTYCNIKPSNSLNYKGYILKHSGLDRIDSNQGYNINNITSCCKRCNAAKNDMTFYEFRDHIIALYNNLVDNKSS